MKVPILNGSQVNPSGQPNVQIQNAQTPQALLGASSARTLADFGEIASGATALYKQQWDEENQIRVQDSVNKVAQLEQSAELDQKNGFRARRGSDVVGFKDEDGNDFINHYTNTIRNGAKEIEESLSNPIQRKMFQQRIAGRETAFNGRVQAYFLDQNNDYKAQVAQTTLETNATSLAMSYSDNATTQQSLDGIASAVGTMGKLKGWDAATTTNETLKLGSKAVLGAIDKMQSDGKTTDIPSYMQQFGKYLTPADQDKVVDLIQKNDAETIEGAILTAKDNDDLISIGKIKEGLSTEAVVRAIGQARANTLKSKAIGVEATINNKLEIAANTKEKAAERAITALNGQIGTSFLPKDDDIASWRDAVKGTSYEAAFNDGIKELGEVQRILTMSPEKQREWSAEKEKKMRSNGASVAEVSLYNKVNTAVQNEYQQLRNDPYGFLTAKTPINIPDVQWSSLSTPQGQQNIQAEFRARLDILKGTQVKYGQPNVPLNPLKPNEVAGLKSVLANSSYNEQAAMLGNIALAIGDKTFFMNAMQQLGKNSPVVARAGQIAALRQTNTYGGTWSPGLSLKFGSTETVTSNQVATTLLMGAKTIEGQNKPFKLPDNKIEAYWKNNIGTSIYQGKPDDLARDKQVFKAYLAGLYAQGKFSDIENPSDDILKMAARDVIGQKSNKFGVLIPLGMDETDFNDRVDSKVRGAGYAPYSGLKLIRATDEKYLIDNGGQYLIDKSGVPVTINVGN